MITEKATPAPPVNGKDAQHGHYLSGGQWHTAFLSFMQRQRPHVLRHGSNQDEFEMPHPWPFYVACSLLALVAVAKVVNPMIKSYEASRPRTHFYSDEAWKNCRAMHDEAKRLGFDAWTCHQPGIVGPG